MHSAGEGVAGGDAAAATRPSASAPSAPKTLVTGAGSSSGCLSAKTPRLVRMSSPSAHGAKSPSASRGKGAVRVSPPGACAKSDRRSRTHRVGARAALRNHSNDGEDASFPSSESEDSDASSESASSESPSPRPRLFNARRFSAILRARRRSRDANFERSSGKRHHVACLAGSSNVARNRTTPPLVQTRRAPSTVTSSS